MAVITVTTASDVVSAGDGKTSLREAVEQASKLAGHVDIRFAESVFFNQTTNKATPIELAKALTITKGDIAIDGSLFYGGNGYGLKLSGAKLSTNAITVEAGAKVTLRDLTLEGSAGNSTLIKGKYGADGDNGANGATGNPHATSEFPNNGLSGGHGGDARDAPDNVEDGKNAVGAIINNGNLTLERVDIRSFKTEGGAGGLGGYGGKGGFGGNGQAGPGQNFVGTPGSGGDGGDSGDGANGGDGGAAVAGIYNVGNLTLRDTTFSSMVATGGRGGQGGDGDRGGHGGNSGRGQVWETLKLAHAGDGGNGGNGGDGGNGGVAAAALLNLGTVSWGGLQSAVRGSSPTAGAGGIAGDYGEFGVGGVSYQSLGESDPRDGKDGVAGVKGHVGGAGGKGDFVGTAVKTGASFIIDAANTIISETGNTIDRVVYFSVRLLGAGAGPHSVKWNFAPGSGVTAADFEGGLPKGGTLNFSGSTNEQLFGYRIAKDALAEGIETFKITLSDPKGGVIGWSKSVTVAITDGTLTGLAPTAIKLSANSIAENSANGGTVGSLSTADSDKGDNFSYELVNSAGGRFALSGSVVTVANGVLLDYEQARSHAIVVRTTDLFGNSIDRALTINVANVATESIKGDALANKLKGGVGNDRLNGAGGNDVLTGGGGNDTFVFNSALNKSTNVDHITDFSHGHDKILLENAIFTGLAAGTLAAAAFQAGAALDSGDHILYAASGVLSYDKDGKGGAAAIPFAILDGHPAITNTDFVVF